MVPHLELPSEVLGYGSRDGTPPQHSEAFGYSSNPTINSLALEKLRQKNPVLKCKSGYLVRSPFKKTTLRLLGWILALDQVLGRGPGVQLSGATHLVLLLSPVQEAFLSELLVVGTVVGLHLPGERCSRGGKRAGRLVLLGLHRDNCQHITLEPEG